MATKLQKIQKYYVIFVDILQAKVGKTEKENHPTELSDQNTKNQKTKIWDERNTSRKKFSFFSQGTAVMEIQLIHIHDSYEETDIMKALKKRNNKTDTLAILSVLVELQKSDNTKLDSLFNATQNVKAMNDTQEFKGIRLGVIFNHTYSFEMACMLTTLNYSLWSELSKVEP